MWLTYRVGGQMHEYIRSVSQMLVSTMMITVLVLQCHNIISIKPTVNLYTCNNCASTVNVTLIKAVWSIISQFIVLHWSPTPGKVNALILRLYCVNFHSQMSMQVHDNVHYNDLATSQQPCMICREIELSIACTVACTLNKKTWFRSYLLYWHNSHSSIIITSAKQ